MGRVDGPQPSDVGPVAAHSRWTPAILTLKCQQLGPLRPEAKFSGDRTAQDAADLPELFISVQRRVWAAGGIVTQLALTLAWASAW